MTIRARSWRLTATALLLLPLPGLSASNPPGQQVAPNRDRGARSWRSAMRIASIGGRRRTRPQGGPWMNLCGRSWARLVRDSRRSPQVEGTRSASCEWSSMGPERASTRSDSGPRPRVRNSISSGKPSSRAAIRPGICSNGTFWALIPPLPLWTASAVGTASTSRAPASRTRITAPPRISVGRSGRTRSTSSGSTSSGAIRRLPPSSRSG